MKTKHAISNKKMLLVFSGNIFQYEKGIIILVIVALLVILAVRKAKKDKMISKCGGNCSACTLKCNKK